ncbi:LAFA_0C05600g1_1 [Lachancea sp. 'fantastica']|nr:LAFA_0C05600g1_1 [Lachancea sp. 'fantastica']
MEFFYEEQAANNGPGPTDGQLHNDKTTEEAFEKFEGSIDRQYQKTADAVKKFIQNEERALELNIPLDAHISERAQDALDSLDHQIHNVENMAHNYWQKVSNPSFWSNVSGTLGLRGGNDVEADKAKKGDLPVSSRGKASTPPVAGNRTEAELKLLSSDKNIYLNYSGEKSEDDKTGGFDVDKHTSEISDLLKVDETLSQTMNSLVPEHVTYARFWEVYFVQKQKILDMENQRKSLLQKESTNEGAPVSWDDEDEDDKPDLTKDAASEGVKEAKTDKVSGSQQPLDGSDEDDDDWQ